MKRASYDREIINRGEGHYEVQCVVCETWFTSQRYDASFCSSTCRSKHHRAAGQLEKEIKNAQAAIDTLIKKLPRHGESKTYEALEQLQRRITAALNSVEMETSIGEFECRICGQRSFQQPAPGQKCDYCKTADSYIKLQ